MFHQSTHRMSLDPHTLLQTFSRHHVLVVGDVMLDEQVIGRVDRISPEAPVPIVEMTDQRFTAGGAANVALNVCSLGGAVTLLGVVGEDAQADSLEQVLNGHSVGSQLVTDPSRPTTTKTRLIAQGQQLVRLDRERRAAIDERISTEIASRFRTLLAKVSAVVLSDYGKGVLTPALTTKLIAEARAQGKPVIVDPKGRDFQKYARATVLTPNAKEAVLAADLDSASVEQAGEKLLKTTGAEAILVTRSEKGMSLFQPDRPIDHIPATAREVYDVTGAGDTVVSALALSLSAGFPLADAARLANYAAGLVVGKRGTATVTPGELAPHLVTLLLQNQVQNNR